MKRKKDIIIVSFIVIAIFGSSLRQAIGTGQAAYLLSGDELRSLLSGVTGDVIWLAALIMAYHYGANWWTRGAIVLSAITSLCGNFYLDLHTVDTRSQISIAIGIMAVISLDVLPTGAALCLSEGLAKSWKQLPPVVVERTNVLTERTHVQPKTKSVLASQPELPDAVIAEKVGVKPASITRARHRLKKAAEGD